jgi:hypothetical protein
MKKLLPSFLLMLFLFSTSILIGQNNVTLKINHKLGDADFAFNTEAANNMDNQFNVDRLEYYMSGFTLFHDDTSTEISDLYFLVRANEETVLDLGSFDIDNITEIRFHIGVDEDPNHSDPSGYSPSNPLSPQFPSMHWGWAAGYRFIAMEGKSGASLNQEFQLHGLGDDNYLETRKIITPTTTAEGILIELDADYTRVIEDVNVSGGVISHGETGAAKTALQNMRDFVFSQTGSVSDVTDYTAISKLAVFPNPTANQEIQISVETVNSEAVDLQLFRVDGSLVNSKTVSGNNTTVMQLDAKGFYFLRVSQNGQTVAYQKIVAQ